MEEVQQALEQARENAVVHMADLRKRQEETMDKLRARCDACNLQVSCAVASVHLIRRPALTLAAPSGWFSCGKAELSSTRAQEASADAERARKRRYTCKGCGERGHSVKTCGRVRM